MEAITSEEYTLPRRHQKLVMIHPDSDVLARFAARQAESLDALLPQCDFVSLHCPGGPENRHLMNGVRLSLMKPDAYLINTARGEVENETALAQAPMYDTIGGAARDVF